MKRVVSPAIAAYLLAVLLATVALSPLPYEVAAVALMAFVVVRAAGRLQTRLRLIGPVAVMFVLPMIGGTALGRVLSWHPYAIGALAALAGMPVLHLIDDDLRHTRQPIVFMHAGRRITSVSACLAAVAVAMGLLSFVVNSPALLFSGLLFGIYLIVMLARAYRELRKPVAETPPIRKRVIAGQVSSASVRLRTISPHIRIRFAPAESWLKIGPPAAAGAAATLDVVFTPPLAGPVKPLLKASFEDRRGLVQADLELTPLELHVIPRAKYAEWLALRYLEQAKSGTTPVAVLPPRAITFPIRGVEYSESRGYLPGDQLKDIDWKHSIKLGELVIKQYIEAGQQAAILAVNLVAGDLEAADRLAFDFITSALTLAREGAPTSLAAYDGKDVIVVTSVLEPRQMVAEALTLVKSITIDASGNRYLKPPEVGRLQRNIGRLRQAQTTPAVRLGEILEFEYRAMDTASRQHPATLALLAAAGLTPPPAMIVLVSHLNHDAEAAMVTAEKLSRRAFRTVVVGGERKTAPQT